MERIQNQLNLPDLPALPRAKSGFRKDKRHYRELLGTEDKMAIGRLFAREIDHFGFVF